MSNFITRTASLVLAFGLLFGCSILPITQKNSDNAQTETSTEDLNRQLEEVNQQLSSGNSAPPLYLTKGELLNELAQRRESPSSRTRLYREMHQVLATADSLYRQESDSEGRQQIDQLLQVSWSNEHNQGVELLQNDSTATGSRLDRAATHFHNAITIIPDSTISYTLKARSHYRNNQTGLAIETLEQANRRIDQLPAELLEQLAFLYLESDRPRDAIRIYEQAEQFTNNNLNLLHGLANAYMLAEEHRNAADLLEVLVSNEPKNSTYRQAYGNELYSLAAQKTYSLLQAGTTDTTAFSAVDSLITAAGQHLGEAYRFNPDNPELKENLAFFHQNAAAQYNKIDERISPPDTTVYDEPIQSHLNEAIPLLQELTRQRPQNKVYWERLYQIYSYLGMQEQAEEARTKANL